jgi:flagellin-specific chaperone FliS
MILQKTIDSFDELNLMLKKENISVEAMTIYEYFFTLNDFLKPKKQAK